MDRRRGKRRALTVGMTESTLADEMKRKFLYLAAAIAELARFLALMQLSANFGAIGDGEGAPRLFRYAAAPQLLFSAAFFFLWLDYGRYGSYRPLVAVGKLVALVAIVPLALEISYSFVEPGSGIRDPRAAFLALAFIGAEDLFALGLAAKARLPAAEAASSSREAPAIPVPAPAPEAPPRDAAESVSAEMPSALPEPRAAGKAEA